MFGDAVAMQSLVRDFESTILFRNISDACLINDATRQSGNKKTSLQPLTATWRCLARTFGALTTSIPATLRQVPSGDG
jgi:hypothetical protein